MPSTEPSHTPEASPPTAEHPTETDLVAPGVEIDTSCNTESEIPVKSNWIDSAHKHKVVGGAVISEEHKQGKTHKEPTKKTVSSSLEESKKEENKKVAAPMNKQLNQIEKELEHTNAEVLAMEKSVKKMLSEQETSTKFVVELQDNME